MSDHPSKVLERQITVFLEHLVGEAFLMLGMTEAFRCFNIKVALMVMEK